MKRLILGIVILALIVGAGQSLVRAGGWATVRLDDAISELEVGETTTVELSVWAHDRARTDVEEVALVATNVETGETIRFEAVSTGEVGGYSAEISLPSEGNWKIVAQIPPYPDFALPTVNVMSAVADADAFNSALNIAVGHGDCRDSDTVLAPVELSPATSGSGVFKGAASSEIALAAAGNFLALLGADNEVVACSSLFKSPDAANTVIALMPVDGESEGAVVLLSESGDTTQILALPISLEDGASLATIEISSTGPHDWTFDPATVEISAADTVVWINKTSEVHTIASTSPDFLDSSLIEPMEMFAQQFTSAGEYDYICGPHQWMTGTITVGS